MDSTDVLERKADRMEALKQMSVLSPVSDIDSPEPLKNNLSVEPIVEVLKTHSDESGLLKNDNVEEVVLKEEVTDKKRVDLDKKNDELNDKKIDKVEVVDIEIKEHLDWLKEDEEGEAGEKKDKNVSKKDDKDYEKEISTYKSKVDEYELILNDDYVKAIVEFRKTGGTDLSELNNYLGIVNTDKITIEDFYKTKAAEQGLKGDELTDAVDESVDRYKSLPKIDQAEILNNFKNTLKNKTEEKLKSFSEKNQEYMRENERIQANSISEFKKQVTSLVGKKWRGLLIDEDMGKVLLNTPDYSTPVVNDKGRIVDYDVKHGVEMAIYAKFGKKLLQAQYKIAKINAYDKLIEERNRPSENMSSNQIVVSTQNDIETISKRRREEQFKSRNKSRE